MAPPRKHETDVILDAARALVLEGGPRAASVAAIAKSSGAPAGTLYHRFGNRDGILTAAWLRALDRFQSRAMAASEPNPADSPAETAVAMAVAAISFARELPQDARLLLTIRPGDLLDEEPDAQFQETVAAMNAPSMPSRARSPTCPMPSCGGTRTTSRCRPGWRPTSRCRCGRC
jgi:AcrR family transcriptional regulator